MHPRPYRLLLRSLAAFLLLLAAGFAQPASAPASNGRTSTVEMNVDRPGNDYKDFDLKVSNAQLCKKECLADSGCHAWTYVRPNTTRGPNPRCYLKHAVPNKNPNAACCISGVVREAPAAGASGQGSGAPASGESATRHKGSAHAASTHKASPGGTKEPSGPKPAADSTASGASSRSGGGITTTAKVEAKSGGKAIPLKPEEKVGLMFVQAIASIEDDCNRHAQHVCTIDEMVQGPKSADTWHIAKLKYDPAKDTNYKYALKIDGNKWQLQANPQHPGVGAFFVDSGPFSHTVYYSAKGPATASDAKLDEIGIDGELFNVR